MTANDYVNKTTEIIKRTQTIDNPPTMNEIISVKNEVTSAALDEKWTPSDAEKLVKSSTDLYNVVSHRTNAYIRQGEFIVHYICDANGYVRAEVAKNEN